MINDLSYAIRTFMRSPGFTATAVLTLALGIGANTAIFSVVNAVLLRPLPYRDPDRLVRVWTSTVELAKGGHSAGEFRDLKNEIQSLEALAGYREGLFTAIARPGEPVQLEGAYVTLEFFDALAIPAALGRTFSKSTDAIPGESKVVLSHEAWQKLYAGSEEASGQRLRVDGESYTVLGVLPPETEWPAGARIWVLSQKDVPPSPLDLDDESADREVRYFQAIARLRPGVTLAEARQDADRVAAIIRERGSATAARRSIAIVPMKEEIVGDVRPVLLVLQGAVGFVLLIACANVSSLMIARATGRRRELAVRAALGAGRGRLVRQLLVESLMLGTAGGAAGLLLGSWLLAVLVGILPDGVPRAAQIALDASVASATLLAALATGVLFGVFPALQASRADASRALKQGGERGSARARVRASLVVAEVALTLVLLAGAGLLVNSFLRLKSVESGFRSDDVTLVSLAVPQSRYPTGASQTTLYERIIEGLTTRGDVEAAGLGFPGPLLGSNASGHFFIEGRSSADDRPFANVASVSAGYLEALGVPILAGRAFADSDRSDAPDVAIVSVALARKYWPGENAVGKRLKFDDDADVPWRTIVGVAGDARQLGLDQPAPPILYIPYQQFPLPFTNVAVRSRLPEGTVASLVRGQLAAIDPELPPGDISTLERVLHRSVAEPRFRALVLVAFAAVALVLAGVGLYGLISYSVAQRTREIGIRMALGATAGQVVGPIVRDGLMLAGVGTVIGFLAALGLARVLAGLLFGVSATDPLTLGTVAIVLLAVALVASYVPSRRALGVDPVTALRAE